jgi:hypothetical protein
MFVSEAKANPTKMKQHKVPLPNSQILDSPQKVTSTQDYFSAVSVPKKEVL